ncbi:MAG: hypothetical protein IKN17_13960 [Ruminococcus sp.]|nr:hypothetical protein [Ruminococcus sp.]MBR6874603.1 hypothetical protein [Ruminococcus sp.]
MKHDLWYNYRKHSFSKLGEKYAEHAAEERGYVDKCIDRILDLGGEVKNGAKKDGSIVSPVRCKWEPAEK